MCFRYVSECISSVRFEHISECIPSAFRVRFECDSSAFRTRFETPLTTQLAACLEKFFLSRFAACLEKFSLPNSPRTRLHILPHNLLLISPHALPRKCHRPSSTFMCLAAQPTLSCERFLSRHTPEAHPRALHHTARRNPACAASIPLSRPA